MPLPMSEDQRSDIKGERETMAGSDETKKVACALWLCVVREFC